MRGAISNGSLKLKKSVVTFYLIIGLDMHFNYVVETSFHE